VSKKKSAPLTSLRAYAKLRGVSVEAVSKAIKAGRLRECVKFVDGVPKIADCELANREWDANTQPRIDQPTSTRTVTKPSPSDDDDDEDLPADVPPYKVSRAKREAAAARREDALADMAEIERDEKREELVPVDEARAFIIDRFAIVKQKLLAVPNRVAQHLPHIASEVQPVVEQYLREVLEELAAEAGPGDGEGEEKE
jgi:hypothetical protein